MPNDLRRRFPINTPSPPSRSGSTTPSGNELFSSNFSETEKRDIQAMIAHSLDPASAFYGTTPHGAFRRLKNYNELNGMVKVDVLGEKVMLGRMSRGSCTYYLINATVRHTSYDEKITTLVSEEQWRSLVARNQARNDESRRPQAPRKMSTGRNAFEQWQSRSS